MAILHVNESEFDREVLQDSGTVLVDFWATWCGPCRMLAPILEELSGQHPELKIVKVDVDENRELACSTASRAFPRCWYSRAARWRTGLWAWCRPRRSWRW